MVEPVPGDQDGLFWRTRMQYVHLPGGDKGLRKHRSHDVVLVDRCLIAHPDAREPDRSGPVVEQVETSFGSHSFTVAGDGFWQVHPGAPRVLVETVMRMLRPAAGERALDLYAGVGLFSAFLAEAVGPTGSVTAVESDGRPTSWRGRTSRARHRCPSGRDRVDRAMHRLARSGDREPVDLVVLDPPRAGAKRQVVRAIADLAPRAVAYVACDPASLARDLGYFAELGYRLADLRAFDLFPMTQPCRVRGAAGENRLSPAVTRFRDEGVDLRRPALWLTLGSRLRRFPRRNPRASGVAMREGAQERPETGTRVAYSGASPLMAQRGRRRRDNLTRH